MKLRRFEGNPILSPLPDVPWQSACTCNPAAWYDGEKVHLLFRGAPDDEKHPIYFGYATSEDGLRFKRVGRTPVFGPSRDGFDAGCVEDPRIVRFGPTYYVTYATRLFPPGPYYRHTISLDHHVPDHLCDPFSPEAARTNLTRTGLAATTDFKHWMRLGPITRADVDDRDVILFPETVDGKFVMLHRPVSWVGPDYGCVKPCMWIAFSRDLLTWRESTVLAQSQYAWESSKIGGATPPIRTDHGWLTLYHGVDATRTYRVGAILLDLKDPRRVIARTPEPILEPVEPYEREGLVPNVVFPCGNVVIRDTLFVYYGGADTYCCVATCPLKELVDHLLAHRV